jgi:hypothetical protein
MERGPFLDDEVQKEFGRFVSIVLHTDGNDAASDRNAAFQLDRFGTRANPLYVLLDPTGEKVYWQRGGTFEKDVLLEALRSVP